MSFVQKNRQLGKIFTFYFLPTNILFGSNYKRGEKMCSYHSKIGFEIAFLQKIGREDIHLFVA